MTEKNVTILDLDSILDTDLDSVKTMPDFMDPPAGQYEIEVADAGVEKFEDKEKQQRSRLKITYKVAKTVKLADSNGEPPVADGTMFSENFQGTEQGLEFFKKRAGNLAGTTEFGGAKIRDILDGIKGLKVGANIKYQESVDKTDPTKKYINMRMRILQGGVEQAE